MHSVIQDPSAVTRGIVRETFEFPFLVCGVGSILALVESTNKAALRFDEKLGFVRKLTIPGGGVEADLVILEMTRHDCRWIRKENDNG